MAQGVAAIAGDQRIGGIRRRKRREGARRIFWL